MKRTDNEVETEETAESVSEKAALLAAKELAQQEALSEEIQFYIDTYPEVYTITCEKCGNLIALEILDPNKPHPAHPHQRIPVPVNNRLLSWRVREDDLIGYQCGALLYEDRTEEEIEAGEKPVAYYCKNNSMVPSPISSDIPRQLGPLSPYETMKLQKKLIDEGYEADVKVNGKKTTIEGFTTERVK